MANDRRSSKFAIASAVAVVVLIGGGLIFNWSINRTPLVRIPPRRSVHPNAFDYYMPSRTGPQIGMGGSDWGYAIHWATSRRPQPKPKLPPAVRIRKVPAQPGVAYYDEYALATLAEKQAMLRGCSPWLSRARRGLRYRCLVPRRDYREEYFPRLRYLCPLLVLDGQIEELHGDWDGALGAYLDSLIVGADLAHGAGDFEAEWSAGQQRTAASNAACCVEHVSASSARAGARRVAGILADQPPWAHALVETKHAVQTELLGYLAQPDWRKKFVGAFGDLGVRDYDPRMDQFRAYTVSKTAIMNRCNYWMDLRIAEARKPFPLDRTPEPTDKQDFLHFFTTLCEPSGTESRKYWEYAHALDGLLELALALRAWKLEHGAYPNALPMLVPGYLDRLPRDPFAIRGTYRYKNMGVRYRLYSVGPDGRDDAGRPLKDIRDTKPVGDIVWGVTGAEPPLPHSLVFRRPVRPIPRRILKWNSEWDYMTSTMPAVPMPAAPP